MIVILKRHLFLFSLCAIFLSFSTILILFWFNSQLNPDATSYITIAQKYASGDFKHAINGYWGPLLSILLVPSIWLHIDPIIAAKIISVLAVIVILIVAYRFMLQRQVVRSIANLVCTAIAIFALSWVTYDPITPDVILAMLIVILADRLIALIQKPSTAQAILVGLVGVLMYFTKGFGLFLFIGVIGTVMLWEWRTMGRKLGTIFRTFLPAIGLFLLLVLPFIIVLSIKYHQVTINNAGSFNHRMYGYYGLTKGNFPPVTLKDDPSVPRLPHNATAVNPWEDPSYLTPLVRDWGVFDSIDHFKFYIFDVVGANVSNVMSYIYTHGPLVMLSFAALALGWLQRKKYKREFVLFGIISVLMITGYALVFAEGRYFWALVVLGMLGTALIVDSLYKRGVLSSVTLIAGGVVLCTLTAVNIGQTIINFRHVDQPWRGLAATVKDVIPEYSRVMSDSFDPSFRTCYHLRVQCSGDILPPLDQPTYFMVLKENGISYYISHHTRDQDPRLTQFVDSYFTQVKQEKFDGATITVYKIKD